MKQFVGSAYKKYKYFTAKVLYSTADAAVEERLSFLRATAEERSFSRWQSTDWAQTTAERARSIRLAAIKTLGPKMRGLDPGVS